MPKTPSFSLPEFLLKLAFTRQLRDSHLHLIQVRKPGMNVCQDCLDLGDTWNDMGQANLANLRKGAGFGIRVEVPMMGTIGFDYGYGFDKLGGPSWEPHFNIGTMF